MNVWFFLLGCGVVAATVLVWAACIVAGRADEEAEKLLREWRGR